MWSVLTTLNAGISKLCIKYPSFILYSRGQSAKTADWLVDNDVIWPVLRNCACANPRKLRSALYSTHQNHIDRARLRLNFGQLVTCYTNERCLRCFLGSISFALSLIVFGRSCSRQQRVNITSITVFCQILYMKF